MDFNLDKSIDLWNAQIKVNSAFTDSDTEELKSHLLDLIDELIDIGLDEEEAFWVASKRLGYAKDLEDEYVEINNSLLQMKKSIVILAGVLAYFLFYYFLKSSSKLFLIIELKTNIDGNIAIQWMSRYIVAAHFLFILFAASLYFLEEKTISLIGKIKIRPNHAFYLLSITIIFAVLDSCLLPISKNIIKQGIPIQNRFYDIYFYFGYTFPLVICTCFVLIYIKYFKKAKM